MAWAWSAGRACGAGGCWGGGWAKGRGGTPCGASSVRGWTAASRPWRVPAGAASVLPPHRGAACPPPQRSRGALRWHEALVPREPRRKRKALASWGGCMRYFRVGQTRIQPVPAPTSLSPHLSPAAAPKKNRHRGGPEREGTIPRCREIGTGGGADFSGSFVFSGPCENRAHWYGGRMRAHQLAAYPRARAPAWETTGHGRPVP